MWEKRNIGGTKNSQKNIPFLKFTLATDGILSKLSEHSVLTEGPFGLGPFGAPHAVEKKPQKQ